jgi:membrane protein DedA with SNARE-associated domain
MSIETIIQTIGYPAVFIFVTGECMGIPMPGETGLLIAAAAAGTGKMFNIYWVIIVAASGAIIGDTCGYWIGRKGGRNVVLRLMGKFHVKTEHLEKAEKFFEHHGGKAVFFGRSVSYLRVLTALLAGVSHMHYPRFLLFNALGGCAWALVFGLAAFYFGKNLSVLKQYIHEMAIGTLIVAIIAAAIYFLMKKKWRRGKLKA